MGKLVIVKRNRSGIKIRVFPTHKNRNSISYILKLLILSNYLKSLKAVEETIKLILRSNLRSFLFGMKTLLKHSV